MMQSPGHTIPTIRASTERADSLEACPDCSICRLPGVAESTAHCAPIAGVYGKQNRERAVSRARADVRSFGGGGIQDARWWLTPDNLRRNVVWSATRKAGVALADGGPVPKDTCGPPRLLP